jgi:hypothetical protein
MEKRKLAGAVLLFIGAFVATRQVLQKPEWTTNHYILLGCSLILIGIGIYAITKKARGN